MIEHKPRLVLNLDALAQGERNKSYQLCDGIYAELSRSTQFDVEFAVQAEHVQRANDFLRAMGVAQSASELLPEEGLEGQIILSLTGATPEVWRRSLHVIRAYIFYDLLSLEQFEPARALVAELDTRAVILVSSEQIKQRLLCLRPELSPAQFSVIPLVSTEIASREFDWGQSAALAAAALLDAYRRFRARPASMLWQCPAELPADPHAPASYLGFHNGAHGPSFNALVTTCSSGWPVWSDTLPASAASARPEGGLRTRGILKAGTDDAPLVSYITVVRNNIATLDRAIESVRAQTYGNVEHIVLDGASTDGTVDLILRHADRLDYYVSEPDRGLYDAINKAVPLARGQLICILNSDDWLEPHAAEIAVRRMLGHTGKAALLATGAVIYSLDGRVEVEWPPMFVHPGSYFACANICHNGAYATRLAYERSGPYDTTFRIAADFKWGMACVDAGVDFVYTREVTVNYSLGGTSGDARGHSRECQRVVAERFPYLTAGEVQGLYDSYFLFAHQPHEEPVQRHESLTALLRRLFAAHSDQPDFQAALTWAAMTKLEHPADCRPAPASAVQPVPAVPSAKRAAKDLVKGLLHRFPRLYDSALRGYARIRR